MPDDKTGTRDGPDDGGAVDWSGMGDAPPRTAKPPPQGSSDGYGRMGRMFPGLPSSAASAEALAVLSGAIASAGQQGMADNPELPAGYTFLGQFVGHDITFDTTGYGASRTDPGAAEEYRPPRLNLDGVYGRGPGADPGLYDLGDPIPARLIPGVTAKGGREVGGLPFDLPRNAQGTALVPDARNDGNLLLSQTHLALILFHDAVAARMDGASFREVRQRVVWHYQHVVLLDFVKRVVDLNDIAAALRRREFFRFEETSRAGIPYIPVEFSGAAYRFLPSTLRESYSCNRALDDAPLNLLGQPPGAPASGTARAALPGDRVVDWQRFFDIGGATLIGTAPGAPTPARRIGPWLPGALHALSVPQGSGAPRSLAERYLRLGRELQLPSGQDVAKLMGYEALAPGEIADSGPDGRVAKEHGLHKDTPLWYYILKESQIRQEGQRLGSVGSRILAEVFVGLLQGDPESFIGSHPGWSLENQTWKPDLPGNFAMRDLLRVAYSDAGALDGAWLDPLGAPGGRVASMSALPGPTVIVPRWPPVRR
jgi:hypothetical protein